MQNKEYIQESQYHFPYHHLSHETQNGFYIFRHLFWGLEHYTYITFVIEHILRDNFRTIADVGCGEGRIISELEKGLPQSTLTGFDVSEVAIHFARGFTKRSTFYVHDITKEPLPNTYDSIVSCEVIEHIKPDMVDSYCKNISKSLSPGGILYITTPTTNLPINKKHYQHFTKESLTNYLSPYFDFEEISFLNKISTQTKILNSLLGNRFFISNLPALNKWILRRYKTNFLVANETSGTRIFIKAKKKS